MIIVVPSPVALFLLSCFRRFLCSLGNVIIVFVFFGSHVSSLFYVTLLLFIGPFFGFMLRFHFFTFSLFPFNSSYVFFTFLYNLDFLFHLFVRLFHFFELLTCC